MDGIIDRIVDGKWAVILVGEDEMEYIVEIKHLPAQVKEGSKLSFSLVDHQLNSFSLLETKTKLQQDKLSEKMELLRSRKKSNFKR